jgi:hypothetical protein
MWWCSGCRVGHPKKGGSPGNRREWMLLPTMISAEVKIKSQFTQGEPPFSG